MSEELPPFLFTKKPIESPIHPHLAISDILPKPPSPPFTVNHEKPDSLATSPAIFETVDFDQQIRAPRMTLATHYVYGNQEKSSSQQLKDSLNDKPVLNKEYFPASVDLSQPTRRFSAPSDLDLANSPSKEMLNYTINNHMYDNRRSQEQQALVRALDNLSKNTTSTERTPETGPSVQQLYKQKKPMSIPAVLRANDSSSSSRSSPSSPYMTLKSALLNDDSLAPSTPKGAHTPKHAEEPTHDHWKPNSYASYCIKCFDTFGTFFTPQRKRRHHCRFCGFIFCYNCLYNGNDDTKRVYLDKMARFVIPISLDADNSQFKSCKVCRDCGVNYARLVAATIPSKDNLSHIFVENPYTSSPQPSPIPMLQPTTTQGTPTKPSQPDRRPSIGVSSDWTWSSF